MNSSITWYLYTSELDFNCLGNAEVVVHLGNVWRCIYLLTLWVVFRWKNWIIRGIFTWVMILGFGTVVWLGPLYMVFLVCFSICWNFCSWTFLCCSFVVDISMCCMSILNNLCLQMSFVSYVSPCNNSASVGCTLLTCLSNGQRQVLFLWVKGEIPSNLGKLKMFGGNLCVKMQRLLFKNDIFGD